MPLLSATDPAELLHTAEELIKANPDLEAAKCMRVEVLNSSWSILPACLLACSFSRAANISARARILRLVVNLNMDLAYSRHIISCLGGGKHEPQ